MAVPFVIALSIFLGLLFFLYHEVQRSAGPRAWGKTPRWRKRIRVALATIPVLIASLVIYAFFIEPNRLVLRHETIQINQWPNELSGIRIAVISDIHVGGWFIDDEKLRLIVEETNKLQPTLIVIAGDFMSGHPREDKHAADPESFAPKLKGFNAPLGVYAVLGNHDWWWGGKAVRQALEVNGIKVLDDEVAEISHQGTSFWLAGLADLWTRPQNIDDTIAKVPEGKTVIALTHNPDIFPRVPRRVSLLIAGHTHGGQIRFPFIGPVIQPSKVSDRYVRGQVFESSHHLFVTTGIGTSIVPVRFGVPPEIVLLTLQTSP